MDRILLDRGPCTLPFLNRFFHNVERSDGEYGIRCRRIVFLTWQKLVFFLHKQRKSGKIGSLC